MAIPQHWKQQQQQQNSKHIIEYTKRKKRTNVKVLSFLFHEFLHLEVEKRMKEWKKKQKLKRIKYKYTRKKKRKLY